jgi:hypothetical protein
MRTSGKVVVAFLFCINFIAVCMGYIGIDKIERYEYPPFAAGLTTMIFDADFVPYGVVLFWHSLPGMLTIWSATIFLPLLTAYIIFIKDKILLGVALLFTSLFALGVTGFLIWLHAFVDLPHE